jgi:DNA polymerase-3 subunit gamma/tau
LAAATGGGGGGAGAATGGGAGGATGAGGGGGAGRLEPQAAVSAEAPVTPTTAAALRNIDRRDSFF